MVWAVIISVIILILAVLIQSWLFVVVEDEDHFLYVVGAFFLLFIVGAFTVAWLLPQLKSGANWSQFVQTWMQPGTAAKADGADLPLLK